MTQPKIEKKIKTPKHNQYQNVNNTFINFYSWMIGCIKGITVGATYEFFHNNDETINLVKVEEGFSFGYKESIWCCDIL
uniref:Uncharacterized protein n=1 Tax=viral metagenome TaxID=1070528 RepID=A0A6C0DR19_9ZZZZ